MSTHFPTITAQTARMRATKLAATALDDAASVTERRAAIVALEKLAVRVAPEENNPRWLEWVERIMSQRTHMLQLLLQLADNKDLNSEERVRAATMFLQNTASLCKADNAINIPRVLKEKKPARRKLT